MLFEIILFAFVGWCFVATRCLVKDVEETQPSYETYKKKLCRILRIENVLSVIMLVLVLILRKRVAAFAVLTVGVVALVGGIYLCKSVANYVTGKSNKSFVRINTTFKVMLRFMIVWVVTNLLA